MSAKLLTVHHLEFLSLKEAVQARLSLYLSKCHIFGNHMSRLIWTFTVYQALSYLSSSIAGDGANFGPGSSLIYVDIFANWYIQALKYKLDINPLYTNGFFLLV